MMYMYIQGKNPEVLTQSAVIITQIKRIHCVRTTTVGSY